MSRFIIGNFQNRMTISHLRIHHRVTVSREKLGCSPPFPHPPFHSQLRIASEFWLRNIILFCLFCLYLPQHVGHRYCIFDLLAYC